jgi:hypothetical protein
MSRPHMSPMSNDDVDAMSNDDVDELLGWPKLDPAALHGLAGQIVRTIEPHSEADPVAILIQSLLAFGNAAGRNAYYEVEADRHYSNIDVVLVGNSSKARKGTAKSRVMALMKSADEHWTANCMQSGLSSGEGLIWAVRDPIEKQDPIKEKGHVTGYQTVITDSGVKDKRLLVTQSEFASTLRVMARDGNTLSPTIRDSWDTGNLQTLAKNAPARATGAHISILGHITAPELLRYLDSTEAANGFANRFLWLCIRRSKYLPLGGQIDTENFSSIVRELKKALDFAKNAKAMKWDLGAMRDWCDIYNNLSGDQPGLVGAITARAEAQVCRLALLYALLDQSPNINQRHLSAALALWNYCAQSVTTIFGDSMGYPLADEIWKGLGAKPNGMTRTEISNIFGRNRTADEIRGALGFLKHHQKIRFEKRETDGRAAEVCIARSTKETNLTKEVLNHEFTAQSEPF